MLDTIYLATHNKNKVREIEEIINQKYHLKSIDEISSDISWEETGSSFQENAEIKARTLRRYTDQMILAEDSGLVIDYLNGAPVLYSKRFGGINLPMQQKIELILMKMQDAETQARKAHYFCSLAFLKNDAISFYEGKLDGIILFKAKGSGGFGYDPIFCPNGYQQSLAELKPEIKTKISHRSQAIHKWLASVQ